jgi:hypothetical protein
MNEFGVCPLCGSSGEWLSTGPRTVYAVCHEHELAWFAGNPSGPFPREAGTDGFEGNREVVATYKIVKGATSAAEVRGR